MLLLPVQIAILTELIRPDANAKVALVNDIVPAPSKRMNHFITEQSTLQRRDAINSWIAILLGILSAGSSPQQSPGYVGLARDVQQMAYIQKLGQGSYKTVYLVSTATNDDAMPRQQYAMALEKIRSRDEAKQSLKGIRRVEQFQQKLQELSAHDHNVQQYQDSFEEIYDWWFQPATHLVDFRAGDPVFKPEVSRTKVTPRKFNGRSQVLVALKPAYGLDLVAVAERMPELYPVGSSPHMKPSSGFLVAGLDPLHVVDQPALRLAFDLCCMGSLMHVNRLVHRDIKGKNIMLQKETGRPVLIDFGFAEFVPDSTLGRNGKRLCIEEPGKIKGEKAYMLSADARKFQGCAEGDVFAMGRTLYEVIFVAPKTGKATMPSSKLTWEGIEVKETAFRAHLNSPDAGANSRFLLSNEGRDVVMSAIRGMCKKDSPMSFVATAQHLESHVLTS